MFRRLWNSPTITTWGNQLAQSLQLLAVTPLILRNFNQVEITAWFLFSSILILGQIISSRMGLTFSRMISFAIAGATDLSPVQSIVKADSTEPNWDLVERAYGTIGYLNIILSGTVLLSSSIIGYIGLSKIVETYAQKQSIWLAFSIFLATQFLIFIFQKYSIALRGLNYVAITSRWEAIFSLVSIATGFLVLMSGGGIISLAATTQGILLLGILRSRFILRWVEGGKFKNFKEMRYDKEVFTWAWIPFSKGLVVNLSNSGMIHLGSVFYTRNSSPAEAAAYLFTLRMILSIKRFSDTPFISHFPKMSRLLARGDKQDLIKLIQSRSTISMTLLSIGAILFGTTGPYILKSIGSNSDMLSIDRYLIILTLMLTQSYINLGTIIAANGNNIICFKRLMASAISSIILFITVIPSNPFLGLLLGLFVPQIVILNIAPLAISAKMLGSTAGHIYLRIFCTILIIHTLLCCLSIFITKFLT